MALAKQVSRKLLRKEWQIISLVFAQLVLVVLVVFQLLHILGLNLYFYVNQLFFKSNTVLSKVIFRPSTDPADFIVLGIAVIALLAMYFAVKKRQPALYKAQKAAPGIIKAEVKQKLSRIKTEPQAPALLLIEAAFIITLVIAAWAYLDPEIELIKWSKVGIGPPLTTAINAVIAVIVFAVFYYLYSLTAWYRKNQVFAPAKKAKKNRRKSKKAKKKRSGKK